MRSQTDDLYLLLFSAGLMNNGGSIKKSHYIVFTQDSMQYFEFHGQAYLYNMSVFSSYLIEVFCGDWWTLTWHLAGIRVEEGHDEIVHEGK